MGGVPVKKIDGLVRGSTIYNDDLIRSADLVFQGIERNRAAGHVVLDGRDH